MTLERTCTRCFSTFFVKQPEEERKPQTPRTRVEILCDACFAKALTEIIENWKKQQQERQRE
jgi:hypothetical protein